MTTPEIRAALAAYRNEGRMFSPHEWAGMVEALLPKAEGYEYLRRLHPHQFIELVRRNINGEGAFDALVAQAIDQARKP